MTLTSKPPPTATELRNALAPAGILQTDIAAKLGMSEPRLSRILRGRDPMPDGFAERYRTALVEITRERHEAALAAVGA